MDNLKLYAKSEEQTNTLVRTAHVLSADISMKFGIKKCGILAMKRGKIVESEGIKLPDGDVMKQVGQEGYTYFDIFTAKIFRIILNGKTLLYSELS